MPDGFGPGRGVVPGAASPRVTVRVRQLLAGCWRRDPFRGDCRRRADCGWRRGCRLRGRVRWRHYTRLSAVLLAAFGSEFASPAGLSLDDVLDWRRLAPVFDRILAVDRDLDDRKRLVALDLATVLLPRTVRFYSAVAVLTLGSDKQIASAVRDLTPAVGRLMEVIAVKARTYERARARAEKALGQFRAVADQRR